MKRRQRSKNSTFRMGSWGRTGRHRVTPRWVEALKVAERVDQQSGTDGSIQRSYAATNNVGGDSSTAPQMSKKTLRGEVLSDPALSQWHADEEPDLQEEIGHSDARGGEIKDTLRETVNCNDWQSEMMVSVDNNDRQGNSSKNGAHLEDHVHNADNESLGSNVAADDESSARWTEDESTDNLAEEPAELLEPDDTDVLSYDETASDADAEDSAGYQKLLMWQNMLSITLLTGTGRLSYVQYQLVRRCINVFIKRFMSHESEMPSYSTFHRTLLPMLRKWSYVPSEECTAIVDTRKSGARFTPDSRHGTINSAKFRVVLPSSWSRMEASCHSRWHLLKQHTQRCTSGKMSSNFMKIEEVPLVRCSSSILKVTNHILPFGEVCEAPCALLTSSRSTDTELCLHFNVEPEFPDDVLRHIPIEFNEEQDSFLANVFPARTELVQPRSTDEHRSYDTYDNILPTALSSGEFKAMVTETGDLWKAGDLCTLLTTSMRLRYNLILVHHHVLTSSPQTVQMIYIPFLLRTVHDGSGDVHETCELLFHLSKTATVSAIDSLSSDHSSVTPQYLRRSIVPSYGRLSNGKPYFADNILLYSDGFSQYNFKQGSSGGVYCLSLNYPPEIRRLRSRVRVLALTPPGVSIAAGLDAVIDDIVKSSTTGRVVRNADGEDMHLFLNIVGYVCDYHELMTVLDVVGQNGCAPCHLCAFLRYDGHPTTGSRYCYSTEMHSSDSCFARTGARTQALRESNLVDAKWRSIGLKNSDAAKRAKSPLHSLFHKLNISIEAAEIPLTDKQVPVVSPSFDPYRSVLVAPDHLLHGLAINCLELALKALPNRRSKKLVDALITQMLRVNSLVKETRIYNFNKSSLYQTSISGTFCIFFVAVPVFSEMAAKLCPTRSSAKHLTNAHARKMKGVDANTHHREKSLLQCCIDNMCILRDLINMTYWYPRSNVDGTRKVKQFNDNDGVTYFSKLEAICVKYIADCDALARSNEEARIQLDKPNVHRLLELYKHSIPAMGHVRHFSELVFETAHQPLKRAMARSNFKDSHMQAMDTTLADEWKYRLSSIFSTSYSLNEQDDEELGQEIVRALYGRNSDLTRKVLADGNLVRRASNLSKVDILREALQEKQKCQQSMEFRIEWVVSDPLRQGDIPEDCAVVNDIVSKFIFEAGKRKPEFFEKARRLKIGTEKNVRWSSHGQPHDTITKGDVLQALLHGTGEISQHAHVISSNDERPGAESLHYFAIVALLRVNHEYHAGTGPSHCTYAAVRRCQQVETNFLKVDERSSIQLLKLTDSTRRVGIVHACFKDSSLQCLNTEEEVVRCSAHVLSGNLFHYFGRESGYPPRMA